MALTSTAGWKLSSDEAQWFPVFFTGSQAAAFIYVCCIVRFSTEAGRQADQLLVQEAAKKHHHLDLNTLRGHTDCVTALDFSSDACNLTTGEPTLSLPFDQDLSCLRTETF
ncbi:Transducin beta-like protein 2 [Hordeum vulgare]|nr:Transducin beta-like protein 2 [Hordeum vulgare]